MFISKDDIAYRITCDYTEQYPTIIHNVTAAMGIRYANLS